MELYGPARTSPQGAIFSIRTLRPMAYTPAMSVCVRLATPEDAELMHQVMRRSFAEYLGVLRVPSSAHAETIADVRRALAAGGGALAWLEGACVGSARFALEPDVLYVGRV